VRTGVALVTLCAIAFGLTYADHAPLIPLLATEFGLDDLAAGLLSTAVFLSYLVVTLATAGWIVRVPPKLVVAIGLVCAASGAALIALAPAYPVALAAKALQGLGSAVAFVSAQRYIAGLYGERRSHFGLGLYGAGFPLGSGLALVAMPALAQAAGGWRGAFAVEAVVIGTVLIAWLAAPAVAASRPPGDMRDAFRCRNCWATFLEHAGGFGLGFSAATWITVYLLREFSLALTTSGVLGSGLLFMAVVGRTGGGWLGARRYLASKATMRTAAVAILVGAVLLALPGRPLAVALLGALLVGIGVGVPYAAVFNTAAASLPSAPGAAQGLAATGGTAGAMVGAPVMGFAVQTYGFAAAWAYLAVVAAMAFAVTFAMRGEEDFA
jgi:MFS transporter, ACS family, aldohexuronate transporter